MNKYMLVAFSRPVEGRDAEYNDWYNNIHLVDVVGAPGFSSAQRFKVRIPMASEMPNPYLALYQMDAETPEGIEAAKKGLANSNMRRSDASDSSKSVVAVFERFGARQTVPGAKAGTYRIVGLALARPGLETEFDEWYAREHMPEVLQVPGMVSGQRYKLQSALMGTLETNSFVIYEMAANSAEEVGATLKAMAAANIGKSSTTFPEKTRAAVYEACSARVDAPKNKAMA